MGTRHAPHDEGSAPARAGPPMSAASDYQRALGHRLRAIRAQQGMSLADVEAASGGAWKSVVVGAYERGDRAITIARLERLADFYGVPTRVLLPHSAHGRDAVPSEQPPVIIDLTRLPPAEDGHDKVADEPLTAVSRFAREVRERRHDPSTTVLTLRGDDVRTLAVVLGRAPDDLVDELMVQGVVRT